MRSFSVFDPRIYSLLIFKAKRGREKNLVQSLQSGLALSGGSKVDISYKDGWTVVEVSTEISKRGADYSTVSPDIFKIKYDEHKKILRRTREMVNSSIPQGKKAHSYNLFTCGSNDRAWMSSPNDVSLFYMESDISEEEAIRVQKDVYQSNISYLNRMMNRTEEVTVNSLKTSTVSALLYIFGRKTQRGKIPLPDDLLLEIDMGSISASESYKEEPLELSARSPYEESGSEEKENYLNRQNYLINLLALKSKVVELLLMQSDVIDHLTGDIADVKLKGSNLKDEIFDMQNSINEHMKNYIPKHSKKGKKMDFLDRDTYETEKELLTRASVQFSLISEVEHEIMRYRSRLVDLKEKITGKARSVNLQPEVFSSDSSNAPLASRINDQIEGEYRTLEDLMSELSHSRDILSSNIDVLRTFIDTRQREVSEDMSRLMNLLFLVFACIGLADALGNFVILAIEYAYLQGSPSFYTVLQYSALGLVITLLPLLMAALFLYYYFSNK